MRNVGEFTRLFECSASAEIKATDIQALPVELILKIFSYLPLSARYQAGRTCRSWQPLAWDDTSLEELSLQTLFPNLSVIDEAFWRKNFNVEALGLTFDPPKGLEKKELCPALKRMYLARVRASQVTLLTMPKGLTLENLKALLAQKDQAFPFKDTSAKMLERLESVRTEQSYRVLLSHTHTKNSQWRSPKTQKRNLASKGLSLPGVLEITALSALSPEKKLYRNWVGARCEDIAAGDHVNICRVFDQVFIGRSDPLSTAAGLIGAPAAFRFKEETAPQAPQEAS